MNGALLLKPDMSGIETWPDFYRDRETIVAHRWDLSDLVEKIEELVSGFGRYLEIAERGQETYRRHVCGEFAGPLFAQHLKGIVERAAQPAPSAPAKSPHAHTLAPSVSD
jgi:hypothetical protein